MTLCTFSRKINATLGGNPGEMLCSRAARNGWRIVPVIDAAFYVIRGEIDHCRKCLEWEAKET